MFQLRWHHQMVLGVEALSTNWQDGIEHLLGSSNFSAYNYAEAKAGHVFGQWNDGESMES
jgi:hypothetical protein